MAQTNDPKIRRETQILTIEFRRSILVVTKENDSAKEKLMKHRQVRWKIKCLHLKYKQPNKDIRTHKTKLK